jgi:predicted enzyme related to lactoylglutathione lyase
MSEMTEYPPATFCWPELVASDSDAAKEFYAKLFGWTVSDVPLSNDQVYSMASIDGKEVGALYQMWPEQEGQGVPTHWGSYVSVPNIDETVKKAASLGGQAIVEPMDVFDAGRMASIIDPGGAVFSLWQPMKHIGARLVNEHGTLCWNELLTKDTEQASSFYTELFGWSTQDMDMGHMIYTIFMNGEKPAAGMIKLGQESGDVPPNWLVYFAVNDCDLSADETTRLGGAVINPPMDIPNIGRFAVLSDPQGAVFAIIKLTPM